MTLILDSTGRKYDIMLLKNLFRYWTYQVFSPGLVVREKYEAFKRLLEHDRAAHGFMAELEDIYYNRRRCDFFKVVSVYEKLAASVFKMVDDLLDMCPSDNWSLKDYCKKFDFYIRFMLAPPAAVFSPPFTIDFAAASGLDESLSGKKALTLSVVNQSFHLPVPDGFVITTHAFHYFFEYNNLWEPVRKKLADLDIDDPSSLKRTADEIRKMILDAEIPQDISDSIMESITACFASKYLRSGLALRSSAVKEDGKKSFAGQYDSLLFQDPGDILTGYKKVIASKYSDRALYYRICNGIPDWQTPMAVLVLEMVKPEQSGVIYTRDPEDQGSDTIVIHTAKGPGDKLVDGQVAGKAVKIFRKDLLEDDPHRGVGPDLLTLARWGDGLEKYFEAPQDIEWCRNAENKLFILQSRPLHLPAADMPVLEKTGQRIKESVVCKSQDTVCPGTGSGNVFRLEDLSMLSEVPNGAALVVRSAPPALVPIIHRLSAVVVEAGSTASHFSSIAREFNIPCIMNISHGFEKLIHGHPVTVDGAAKTVYKGKTDKPFSEKGTQAESFDDSEFMLKLRYVINFAAQLRLTDPESDAFAPEGCRSLHDIIRFAHETAVREMFFMGNRKGGRKKGARQLVSDVPLLFYILDVGNGVLSRSITKKKLTVSDISSIPLKSVLKGLSHPGICWSETTHFDWEEYDKIVLAGGIISADNAQFGSYAVVAEEYLNVNFRFGYHFVILDAICSQNANENHILFRFSGGGGSPEGRAQRAQFIKMVLTKLGFMVKVTSDLVDAELKPAPLKEMQTVLDQTGRLLGATKLMDMYLDRALDIPLMVEDFMNGRYDFRSVTGKSREV